MSKHEQDKQDKLKNKPTTEELNAAKIKSDAVAESMKTRCKVCFKETSPDPKCFGHGGGGAGGGGGSSNEVAGNTDSAVSTNTVNQAMDIAGVTSTIQTSDTLKFSQSIQLNEKNFNPEIISELLSNKILLVDNNRDLGTLTIKCNLYLLSKDKGKKDELNKFIDAILKELDAFIRERNLPTDCREREIKKDKEGNILSLRITLPTQTLYDAFIQRLANNLVPQKNLENRENQGYSEKNNQYVDKADKRPAELSQKNEKSSYFNPSPFKNKPKP